MASNNDGPGGFHSSTMDILSFFTAHLQSLHPQTSGSTAAIPPAEGQMRDDPQTPPVLDPNLPSLDGITLENYVLSSRAAPRTLTYADFSHLNEEASGALQQMFPLRRPGNAELVRKVVLVPEIIFKMNPSALLTYTMPHTPNPTSVWPDRWLDDNAAASYVAYPLPERVSNQNERCCNHVDLSWVVSRERTRLRAPPHLPPSAATAPTHVTARNKVPQELWDRIINYLTRDDLKALRLTSVKMNSFSNNALFKTIVIPFRQGMFSEEIRSEMQNHTGKGKGKSTAINIFKSYGSHIRKFGISYEMNEARLAYLPNLERYDILESYWGTYYWPLCPTEQPDSMPASVMEEIVGMKEAFSDMKELNELALSINNGLGWLSGPDKSIRSQILHDNVEIFSSLNQLPSRSRQGQMELWDFVKSQYIARENLGDLAQARLYRIERTGCWSDPPAPYTGIPRGLQHIDHRILIEATVPENEPTVSSPRNGFLIAAQDANGHRACKSHPVRPNSLTDEQLDLLMKTQWAQGSMIESYIIGIIDSQTCRKVTTLSLACLPGRYVRSFDRNDFWDALPALESLKMMVMGEFRDIGKKDGFGNPESRSVSPLEAVPAFQTVLSSHVAPRSNIKHLSIGWASGGERAHGITARNQHLLPAPFMDIRNPLSPFMMDDVITFPHVKRLAITNMWMTPRALERLVNTHEDLNLTTLTLDSVSLLILPVSAGGLIPPPTKKVENPVYGQPYLWFPQRIGSWPHVLDAISPGTHFGQLGIESRNRGRKAPLEEIQLISCGYNVLGADGWRVESMDREFMGPDIDQELQAYTNVRRAVIEQSMPKILRDTFLGTIVQHIPRAETTVLKAMWGASFGWLDWDDKFAVILDGRKEGGTGRFCAKIRRPVAF